MDVSTQVLCTRKTNMTLEQITAKLVAMLGEHTHHPENLMLGMPDSPLSEFDIDSLDLVEIAMQIEDEWHFEFLNEDMDSLGPVTLNKLANAVFAKLSPTQGAEHQKEPVTMSNLATIPSPMIVEAGNLLARYCHHAAANWWIDTETGEDVRTWPAKFFKLWVASKLMLIVTEIAEGMEGHRKSKMDDHLPHRTMLEVELADGVIRICDLAGGLGFDLGGAIAEKLTYNAQRLDHRLEHRNAVGGKAF